jgi:hypothetical protein
MRKNYKNGRTIVFPNYSLQSISNIFQIKLKHIISIIVISQWTYLSNNNILKTLFIELFMTDKNRTRYVQKEALYEVLQESVKDKVFIIHNIRN